MELRAKLMPPTLDETKVGILAQLAARLDGANPGGTPSTVWERELAEFNRVAGTALGINDFQGIYGAEEHAEWVRRLLYQQFLAPTPDLSRSEMLEIVSQVRACDADQNFYLELFLVNCKHPSGSDLIFWPNLVPELPQGREPTTEEVAYLAMHGRAESADAPEPDVDFS